ncbi:hypothetical protein SAMN06295879_2264 [Agreia bicolorata]|uniref:DUF4190 domain-containing protein n=1 Tax=Agreia bicolorata TaxID=110935 RepID=A0A1T4Y5E9_9MICO|nr:hypothetical protein [Agreia bicolorata]SKA96541.1 hypothetical protein SAMN06295879_2264 [Agreia bicolorata]
MTNEPAVTTHADPMTGPSEEALATGPVAKRDPHFVLGVVGFALSLIAVLNIVGLTLSIIAFVKSKRAGFTNGFALAGIIIAGLGVLFIVIIAAVAVPALIDAAQTCARLGNGVHELNGATYTCTPSSFNVHRGF